VKQRNHGPKPVNEMNYVPFINAEEAWFWFIRCQRLRLDGARPIIGDKFMARPCEPDDLYRAVMALFRKQRIGPEHLKVLGEFGVRETPPDPRCRDEERPARLWDAALDHLTTILKAKGIVECRAD